MKGLTSRRSDAEIMTCRGGNYEASIVKYEVVQDVKERWEL